jgi:hypothetical protein
MIFRVIDDATGNIVLSLTAPNADVAAFYLKPGQSLATDNGPAMINNAALRVENGVMVRRDAQGIEDPMAGEGQSVTFLTTT